MSGSSAFPEVAVVVPCHGYAHFLPDAIASVAAQTWPAIRCVIVDDGSPDDTAAVAARLIERFPARRIELLRQQNRGLAAARNAGVRATDCPFVLPLDADDELAPVAVERLARALIAGADVATPLGRTFGDADSRLVTLPATRARLRRGNCLVYASMFRRSLFDAVGGYAGMPEGAGYEDWDLWLSALERGARFAHVAEELFRYRKHGATMLAAADGKAALLRARIVANHPALFAPWRRRLAARLLAAPQRPGLAVRLGVLATYLLDRKRRLFVRALRDFLRPDAERGGSTVRS